MGDRHDAGNHPSGCAPHRDNPLYCLSIQPDPDLPRLVSQGRAGHRRSRRHDGHFGRWHVVVVPRDAVWASGKRPGPPSASLDHVRPIARDTLLTAEFKGGGMIQRIRIATGKYGYIFVAVWLIAMFLSITIYHLPVELVGRAFSTPVFTGVSPTANAAELVSNVLIALLLVVRDFTMVVLLVALGGAIGALLTSRWLKQD